MRSPWRGCTLSAVGRWLCFFVVEQSPASAHLAFAGQARNVQRHAGSGDGANVRPAKTGLSVQQREYWPCRIPRWEKETTT